MKSNAVKQAYLNEFKGNLFEFIVAKELSLKFKKVDVFLNSLNPDYFSRLQAYELALREMDENLLMKISSMGLKVSDKIFNFFNLDDVDVYLVGKDSNYTQSEADIILKKESDEQHLSLKFCKRGAYINTKSGGLKSFATKYFDHASPKMQSNFNDQLEIHFEAFSREIHSAHNIEFKESFATWNEMELPQLPGELEANDKEILHKLYHKISHEISLMMTILYKENREEFNKGIERLMGRSHKKVTHVICFHSGTKEYEFDEVIIDQGLNKSKDFDFELNEETSYCALRFEDRVLQLRVKPMNKFTTQSFKLNCSVKYL